MNHARPPTGQAPLVWCLAYSWCFAARDFGLPQGASDEHTLQWSVRIRSEQRRGGQKNCCPKGCAENGLGLRCSSVTDRCGYAPSSRLAPSHFGRNETPAICETPHWLANKKRAPYDARQPKQPNVTSFPPDALAGAVGV